MMKLKQKKLLKCFLFDICVIYIWLIKGVSRCSGHQPSDPNLPLQIYMPMLTHLLSNLTHREPSEDLRDPKKGHLGPKRALKRSLRAQKRPDTRPKCAVTMIPTQSDQSAAVGTKSGSRGSSESLWGPQKGPFGGPEVL